MESDDASILRGHLPALDAVRGIAILMVLAFHFTLVTADDSSLGRLLLKATVLGQQGVDLFFVLSGFLITGILYDAKTKKSGWPYFGDFYARRTLRIFPLYYLVLAITLVIVPFFVTYADPMFSKPRENQAWLWTYLANILMTRDPAELGVFQSYWSLAIEEHFYLFWPFVVFALSRVTLMRVCVAIIVGALALRTGLMLHGTPWTIAAACNLTPCRLDSLACGALMALACRGPRGLSGTLPGARTMAVVGFIGLAGVIAQRLIRHVEANDLLTRTIGFTSICILFGGLIVWCVSLPTGSFAAQCFHNKALTSLGKYSYGLYIYHVLVMTLLLKWISIFDKLHPLGMPIAFAAQVLTLGVCSFGIAYASYHLIEKRFLTLKRYF